MAGKAQVLVRPSYTVKGMEVASKKSDKAKLNMKMFLAVLISFLLRTAHITSKFPNTGNNRLVDLLKVEKERPAYTYYVIRLWGFKANLISELCLKTSK